MYRNSGKWIMAKGNIREPGNCKQLKKILNTSCGVNNLGIYCWEKILLFTIIIYYYYLMEQKFLIIVCKYSCYKYWG